MEYGLDVTMFKNQNGAYEAGGHCCVRRKNSFLWFSWTHKETYPIFVFGQDLGLVARQLINSLRHYQTRGELSEFLGGILRAKFPNYSEVFHPFPNGDSRILIPLSQEEIALFWEQLRVESAAK